MRVQLDGRQMPRPRGEPPSSGSPGLVARVPYTHTDSSLAPGRTGLALLQPSRVGVRMNDTVEGKWDAGHFGHTNSGHCHHEVEERK